MGRCFALPRVERGGDVLVAVPKPFQVDEDIATQEFTDLIEYLASLK
jgi:hypothetical protein